MEQRSRGTRHVLRRSPRREDDHAEIACLATKALLEREGRVVRILGRPDEWDRQRPAPDYALLVDQTLVGLEAVRFALEGEVERDRLAFETANAVRRELSPAVGREGLPGVIVSVTVRHPMASRRREGGERWRLAGTTALIEALGNALPNLRDEDEIRIRVPDDAAPWAGDELYLKRFDAGNGRALVLTGSGVYMPEVEAGEWLEWAVTHKARQTAAYPAGYLAVIRYGRLDADDLAAALRARGAVPWWAVLYVDGDGTATRVGPLA